VVQLGGAMFLPLGLLLLLLLLSPDCAPASWRSLLSSILALACSLAHALPHVLPRSLVLGGAESTRRAQRDTAPGYSPRPGQQDPFPRSPPPSLPPHRSGRGAKRCHRATPQSCVVPRANARAHDVDHMLMPAMCCLASTGLASTGLPYSRVPCAGNDACQYVCVGNHACVQATTRAGAEILLTTHMPAHTYCHARSVRARCQHGLQAPVPDADRHRHSLLHT
jgi:hypothetical protein